MCQIAMPHRFRDHLEMLRTAAQLAPTRAIYNAMMSGRCDAEFHNTLPEFGRPGWLISTGLHRFAGVVDAETRTFRLVRLTAPAPEVGTGTKRAEGTEGGGT